MFRFFGADNSGLHQVTAVFERVTDTFFNSRSLLGLAACLIVAFLLGRLTAAVLRRVVWAIGRQADRTDNLQTVNRLRRYETLIILSIAIIRTILLLLALYIWWTTFVAPGQKPTAIIGTSAIIAIILGGALGPALRDIAAGSVMMAEQWYAVGDHVRLEPFGELQGVVERVTLRSTRVRGLNGDVIWVNNQNIQAVRITPKGVRTLAVEVFVKDLDKGLALVESTNRRLPQGPLLVVNPLHVMSSDQVGETLWHITAIAETAPGREWLIEKYALEVMKEINEGKELDLLAAEPIARFADSDTERRFARAIKNARKTARKRSLIKLGELGLPDLGLEPKKRKPAKKKFNKA